MKKNRIDNDRKGQEEIVGFVMVVVLVAVIFLVFFGITLRNQEPTVKESEIIYQFLDSLMEQTSECSLGQGASYLPLDNLIRECYNSDSECNVGDSSCEILNRTLIDAMSSSWQVGPDYPYKGYELQAIYSSDNTGQPASTDEVFLIASGDCTGSVVGNSYWIPEFPGSITIAMKLCS